MSELIEVKASGAIGKQVFATNRPVVLKQVIPGIGSSGCTVTIRDGNASGTVKLTIGNAIGIATPVELEGVRFDKGMHVKVIGDTVPTYLEIE